MDEDQKEDKRPVFGQPVPKEEPFDPSLLH